MEETPVLTEEFVRQVCTSEEKCGYMRFRICLHTLAGDDVNKMCEICPGQKLAAAIARVRESNTEAVQPPEPDVRPTEPRTHMRIVSREYTEKGVSNMTQDEFYDDHNWPG